jgi:hypothetical protein
MDEVGVMTMDNNRSAQLDRRTAGYGEALVLARHLLRLEGRALAAGGVLAQTFLIRTPDIVEDAIRSVLASGLRDRCMVTKHRRLLRGSGMTINPDLVFSDEAVGDVKYKTDWDAWPRSDLYQSVAFAAGYERQSAVVVSFGTRPLANLETAFFGEIEVSHLQWRCGPNHEPQESEATLIEDARAWWDSRVVGQRQRLVAAI